MSAISESRSAAELAQIIDETAQALECDPQNLKLIATATKCSNKIATYDFGKLIELSETHCARCHKVDGRFASHCDACCRRITRELDRRMHQGPQPDPAKTKDAVLVARCRRCGAIGAGCVIEMGSDTSIDLGQIVQKSLNGFLVRIEPGPCAVTGCECREKDPRPIQ